MTSRPELTRRNLLRSGVALAIPPGVLTLITGCQSSEGKATPASEERKPQADGRNADAPNSVPSTKENPMKIHYLEIVTPDVDALCDQYAAIHEVNFGQPDANLGGARTAELGGGGLLGIRAPMHDQEKPVVRPYVLVEDIQGAVDKLAKAGATIAVPPMELPGYGTCAIAVQGGVEFGLWQN